MAFLDETGVVQLTSDIKTLADATYPQQGAIADQYDSTATYAVGDYCIKNGLLYKCTTAIETAEAWNSGHWVTTQVTDELGNVSEAILVEINYNASTTIGTSSKTYAELIDAINRGCTIRAKVTYVANSGTTIYDMWLEKWTNSDVIFKASAEVNNSTYNKKIFIPYANVKINGYVGVTRLALSGWLVPDGGTTGQALTKNSISDGDYSWLDVINSNSVADTYSSSSAYSIGDYCVRNGQLYKCNTAIASGGEAWNSSHWTATNVANEFGDISSLPSGGTQGQILTKNSSTAGDASWANVPTELPSVTSSDNNKILKVTNGAWVKGDAPSGLPSGGTQGQILTKNSSTAGDASWANAPTELPSVSSSDNGKILKVTSGAWAKGDAPSGLPSGGTQGQVLTKNSSTTGDASWANAPTELPSVTSSDNGKILKVTSGVWAKGDAPTELPSVTSSDNGKLLEVTNGAWAKSNSNYAKQDIIADAYDSTASYAVGDFCIYGGLLYKCTQAINGGETWNAEHWVSTSVTDELGSTMYVTVTYGYTSGAYRYSSDKTFGEINDAINSGVVVYVVFNGNIFNLATFGSSTIYFRRYNIQYGSAYEYYIYIYLQSGDTKVGYGNNYFYVPSVPNYLSSSAYIFVQYNSSYSRYEIYDSSIGGIPDMHYLFTEDDSNILNANISLFYVKNMAVSSDDSTNADVEEYHLTNRYTTNVPEEGGSGYYEFTGHLVFKTIVEENGTKKIKTFHVTASDFWQYHYYIYENWTVTYSEEDLGGGLPAGGTQGQTLIKNSSTDGDASWGNILPTASSENYTYLCRGFNGGLTWNRVYQTMGVLFRLSDSNGTTSYFQDLSDAVDFDFLVDAPYSVTDYIDRSFLDELYYNANCTLINGTTDTMAEKDHVPVEIFQLSRISCKAIDSTDPDWNICQNWEDPERATIEFTRLKEANSDVVFSKVTIDILLEDGTDSAANIGTAYHTVTYTETSLSGGGGGGTPAAGVSF